MKTKQLLFIVPLFLVAIQNSFTQSAQFNVDEYKQFLQNNHLRKSRMIGKKGIMGKKRIMER